MTAPRLFLGLPAPAKINLFLHVIGRRADGYHELQSVFVPVGLADTLDFELRGDGAIERSGNVVGDPGRDLAVRAAQLLQQESETELGVAIHVEKRIPAGSGLGGGSSDAATTLLALNRLWRLGWPRERLAAIGGRLGADVPFFLGGGPAFVEGIGERMTPIELPAAWFAIVKPATSLATAEIFADPGLTRNTKATIISDFSTGLKQFPHALPGTNDLEAVARRRDPEIGVVIGWLARFGPARMTGSGSAAFVGVATEREAHAAIAQLPESWSGWAVQSLARHPLAEW